MEQIETPLATCSGGILAPVILLPLQFSACARYAHLGTVHDPCQGPTRLGCTYSDHDVLYIAHQERDDASEIR